jgi:hypothetical protein
LADNLRRNINMPNYSNAGGGNYERNLMPQQASLGLQDVVALQNQIQNREIQRSDIKAARGASTFMQYLDSLADNPTRYNAAWQFGKQNYKLQDVFEKAGIDYDSFDPSIRIASPKERLDKSTLKGQEVAAEQLGANLYEPKQQEQVQLNRRRSNILVGEAGTGIPKDPNDLTQGEYSISEMEQKNKMDPILAEIKIRQQVKDANTPGYAFGNRGKLIPASKADAIANGAEWVDQEEGQRQLKNYNTFHNLNIAIAPTIMEKPNEARMTSAEVWGKSNRYIDGYSSNGKGGKLAVSLDLLEAYTGYGDRQRQDIINYERGLAYQLTFGKLNPIAAKKDRGIAGQREQALKDLLNSRAAALDVVVPVRNEKGEVSLDSSTERPRTKTVSMDVPSPYYLFTTYWSDTSESQKRLVKDDVTVWEKIQRAFGRTDLNNE